MASQVFGGATLGIVADTPVTFDAAGYGALTYVAVGELTNYGSAAASATQITHMPIDTQVVEKHKGTIDYGQMSMTMASDIADAGQVVFRAGFDGAERNTAHSIEITLESGDIRYFQALVKDLGEDFGDVNSILGGTVTLDITTSTVNA